LIALPAQLAKSKTVEPLICWRLELGMHFPTWAQGIGAEKVGGRWSPKGRAVIYAALDPSTAILEVAVHKGFKALDVLPHHLLAIEILEPAKVHVVQPTDINNSRWLLSGSVSSGQQEFGAALLDKHPFLLVPSTVSTNSWNLVIDVHSAKSMFRLHSDERFGLDPRLNPA
jgi:RES domain-containing protein